LTRATPRVEAIPKERAAVYLRRGRNLLAAATLAEETKNWDVVAIAAVPATICFADAFTIRTLGLRSKGQDHGEVVPLIAQAGTKTSAELAGQVQTVLNRKSEVEYGSRDVSAGDARQILKAATRVASIMGSARSLLVSPGPPDR
jgi:HEPN domain-containing protein